MGYFNCPTCKTWRHITDNVPDRPDHCWMCGTPAPPPCPRCGEPCHKVATPIEPGDDRWVWGHDCVPI